MLVLSLLPAAVPSIPASHFLTTPESLLVALFYRCSREAVSPTSLHGTRTLRLSLLSLINWGHCPRDLLITPWPGMLEIPTPSPGIMPLSSDTWQYIVEDQELMYTMGGEKPGEGIGN